LALQGNEGNGYETNLSTNLFRDAATACGGIWHPGAVCGNGNVLDVQMDTQMVSTGTSDQGQLDELRA